MVNLLRPMVAARPRPGTLAEPGDLRELGVHVALDHVAADRAGSLVPEVGRDAIVALLHLDAPGVRRVGGEGRGPRDAERRLALPALQRVLAAEVHVAAEVDRRDRVAPVHGREHEASRGDAVLLGLGRVVRGRRR